MNLRSLPHHEAFDADVLAMPSTSVGNASEIDKVRTRDVEALAEAAATYRPA